MMGVQFRGRDAQCAGRYERIQGNARTWYPEALRMRAVGGKDVVRLFSVSKGSCVSWRIIDYDKKNGRIEMSVDG